MHSMFSRVVKFAAVAAMTVGFAANVWATNLIVYPDEYSTDCYKGAENLIGHWDGIDNVGAGTNVAGATQWIDLTNLRTPWSLVSGRSSFTTNALSVNGSAGHAAFMNSSAVGAKGGLPKYKTIEICTYWQSGQQLLSNSGSDHQHIFILNWGDGTFGGNRNYYACDPNVKAGGTYRFAITYNGSDTPDKYWHAGTNVLKTVTMKYGWSLGTYPALGSRYGAVDCSFVGKIHSMRLYNRVLTADEIRYNAAIDKARFLGDTSELEPFLPPIKISAANAFDAENGKIVVSATVLRTTEAETSIRAIIRRSDGVVTTNEMAQAVEVSETPYTYDVTDLEGGLSYDLSVLASDEAGNSLEMPAGTVFVGSVAIAAVTDANLNIGQEGAFVVTRDPSETAIANDLVVNYTIGGTAVAGKDYEPLSGQVTIPAGQSEVTIVVKQIGNVEASEDKTLTLTLAPGGYVPDPSARVATIGVSKVALDAPWRYDSVAKTLTDGVWTFAASGATNAITVGVLKKVYVPDLLDLTKPVADGGEIKAIGDNALYECTTLRTVRLPEKLTSIGNCAFYRCLSLTNVVPFLPESVTFVGYRAFQGASALRGNLVVGCGEGTAVTLEGVSQNNGFNFNSTAIDSAVIGSRVTVLKDDVFRSCSNLKDVRLHDGITSIGGYCFDGCGSLTNVTCMTPASLVSIGTKAYQGSSKLSGDAAFGTNQACSVGDRIFYSSGIRSIRFGAGVPTVPECVCELCKQMEEIVLEEGVTKIGLGAFQSCPKLAHIQLPTNSLTRIEQSAFQNSTAAQGLVIEPFLPRSIEFVGTRAFCWALTSCASDLVLDNAYGKTLTVDYATGDRGWTFERVGAKKVTVGRGVNAMGFGCLQDMQNLRELHFTDAMPTFSEPYPKDDHSPFFKLGDRQLAVYLPAEQESWMRFLTNTTQVTPWKTVSDTLKTEFATKFAGYPRPFGLSVKTTAPFGTQWIYKVNPPGMMIVIQ